MSGEVEEGIRWTIEVCSCGKLARNCRFVEVVKPKHEKRQLSVVPASSLATALEALRELLECFDGFTDSGQERVMNDAMPWEDVEPRIARARSTLTQLDPTQEER